VLIVGQPNQRLTRFLRPGSDWKVARVQYLAPGDLKDDKKYRQPAREGAFDLVIFDRCGPKKEADFTAGQHALHRRRAAAMEEGGHAEGGDRTSAAG